jgi:hypothetical protein
MARRGNGQCHLYWWHLLSPPGAAGPAKSFLIFVQKFRRPYIDTHKESQVITIQGCIAVTDEVGRSGVFFLFHRSNAKIACNRMSLTGVLGLDCF